MSGPWRKDGAGVDETAGTSGKAGSVGSAADGSAELYELFSELGKEREMLEAAQKRMTDERLDEALRAGVRVGRRRSGRMRRKRIGLQTTAAALCMLLLLTAFVRISPAFAAWMKEIPGFGGFVELIAYDRSLMSALDNEYLQPLHLSDERNGYTFTVNGIIADSQRAVILYTAEGPGLSDGRALLHYELEDEHGGDIEALIGFNHNFRVAKGGEERPVQDYLDIRMVPGRTMPQSLRFRLELGGEWLSVVVPIDHSRFSELEERIELNREMVVGGQKVTVTEAVVSPLMVSVSFAADPANDKIVTDFIALELVDEQGRKYETPSGFGRLEQGLTRHFESGYFDKPKRLTLRAEGLMMLDRDMKLVIDTEQERLISRPDDKITVSGIAKREDYIELTLRLDQSGDPAYAGKGYPIIGHNAVFHDAEGREYRLAVREGTASEYHPGTQAGVYYYRLPNEDYAQPLTFDIYDYPGYVLQDIAVEIK